MTRSESKHHRPSQKEKNRFDRSDSVCVKVDRNQRQVSIQSFFASSRAKKRRTSHHRNDDDNTQTPPTPFCPSSPETPPSALLVGRVTTPPSLSPIVQKESSIKRPRIGKANWNQLYLDLGQRDFGKRSICSVCGMLFVHGVTEDSKQHQRICRDYRQGISFRNDKSRQVAAFDDGAIVEVRPSDSYRLRQKVKRVKSIVDAEIGFVDDTDAAKTAYLYISKERQSVVGFATAEVIKQAFMLDDNGERSDKQKRAMVGIHQVWVHKDGRRQGVASKLITAIRQNFVFGMTVPYGMTAFSSPTQQGIQFARSLGEVLVYDIGK